MACLLLAHRGFAQQPAQNLPRSAPIADPALIDPPGFVKILKAQRGKPLLLNFWATWCEPCRDEYPMINELARRYGPQGLAVVGISLDQDGEITLVRRFLARNRPVFPNYRARHDSEEKIIHTVNPDWNGSIPATFFYDRNARLATYFIGTRSREEFERAIQDLLARASEGVSTPKDKTSFKKP